MSDPCNSSTATTSAAVGEIADPATSTNKCHIAGDDLWIGVGVLVRTGVTIGTRSLVLQDVEPYAMFAGTPARLIRYRHPEESRVRLPATRW